MNYRADHDLTGTIHSLVVYPIKSCAGIAVQQARLTATGLEVGAISDVTPTPHNGVRPPKRRRV